MPFKAIVQWPDPDLAEVLAGAPVLGGQAQPADRGVPQEQRAVLERVGPAQVVDRAPGRARPRPPESELRLARDQPRRARRILRCSVLRSIPSIRLSAGWHLSREPLPSIHPIGPARSRPSGGGISRPAGTGTMRPCPRITVRARPRPSLDPLRAARAASPTGDAGWIVAAWAVLLAGGPAPRAARIGRPACRRLQPGRPRVVAGPGASSTTSSGCPSRPSSWSTRAPRRGPASRPSTPPRRPPARAVATARRTSPRSCPTRLGPEPGLGRWPDRLRRRPARTSPRTTRRRPCRRSRQRLGDAAGRPGDDRPGRRSGLLRRHPDRLGERPAPERVRLAAAGRRSPSCSSSARVVAAGVPLAVGGAAVVVSLARDLRRGQPHRDEHLRAQPGDPPRASASASTTRC